MLSDYYGYYLANRAFAPRTITAIEQTRMKYDNWVIGYHDIDLQVLKAIKRHYDKKVVYLMRDPRDCAISFFFYQAYQEIVRVDRIRFRLKAALLPKRFVRKTLEAWKEHVSTYKDECDEIVSYEELLNDCAGTLARLTGSQDLDKIAQAVDDNSFKAHSCREPGQEDIRKFARKGISGDWVNHYSSPGYKNLMKEVVGKELVEFGYEKDFGW